MLQTFTIKIILLSLIDSIKQFPNNKLIGNRFNITTLNCYQKSLNRRRFGFTFVHYNWCTASFHAHSSSILTVVDICLHTLNTTFWSTMIKNIFLQASTSHVQINFLPSSVGEKLDESILHVIAVRVAPSKPKVKVTNFSHWMINE